MEIVSRFSPRDRILQTLAMYGVPQHYVEELHPGLIAFLKDNNVPMAELVPVILPTDAEVARALHEAEAGSRRALVSPTLKDLYRECLVWLQWLMFEGEPCGALEKLANMNIGQRGVCGAIWGKDDIAFRCQTCELDPTCAICVPCFQNGNHKDHDYSIIYTGGGCCDCGDETAWKREGFCSNHKGAENIQPLPEHVAQGVGPVLDSLFDCWKEKLTVAERISTEHPRVSDNALELIKVANELTSAMVDMLLDFSKHSESLLSFVAWTAIYSVNLLNILARAERFLSDAVTKKLHELLLKLLGEPTFKYEFGKVFVNYYPVPVNEAIQNLSDSVLKKYPLLSTFCVQIFTVPTLTPSLVKEVNLLVMLLECLGNIFLSCSGDDGRLQVDKWGNLYNTSIRVIEDLKFVLTHPEVAEYATNEHRDISTAWIKMLSFVQGMNPRKREIGIHIEEENENMHLPFILCHLIARVNYLLVTGAFAVSSVKETFHGARGTYKQDGNNESQRHANVGKLSLESSACTLAGQSSSSGQTFLDGDPMSDDNHLFIPSSVLGFEAECLRAVDRWLEADTSTGDFDVLASDDHDVRMTNFLAFKEVLSKLKNGEKVFSLNDDSLLTGKFICPNPVDECSDDGFVIVPSSANFPIQSSLYQNNKLLEVVGMDLDDLQNQTYSLDSIMEEPSEESESFFVFSLSDWPDIDYDVSSQEISFHMPLHGLLSLTLKEILQKCYGDSARGPSNTTNLLSSVFHGFFGKILKGCHPYGFSCFMMEHPLRLRVFCAQVHAGMWKKNGEVALLSCEWYRSVRWSEHELELDLFSLQLCAALAPADAYVRRILERFGLSSYTSLELEQSSEYEPVLVQEMLTLIIQIITERRFCGLTATENLQRELVCKLAVGNATRSQLVKSLPSDISKCDQLQEILDKIAQYSTPSGMNQGKYSLCYPYWKELDLYHPRWNPRDLQLAEERYLRFCGASALNVQLPKWTDIYQPLEGISRVATCNVVLQIVRAVLFYHIYSDNPAESRAPDGVLVTALHLLSLGLDICSVRCESGYNSLSDGDQIPLLAFACEEISVGLHKDAGRQSLLSLLVLLLRMHKKESCISSLEAGNFNLPSLVERLLKKFSEMDSRCRIKLQLFAPEVIKHLFKSSQGDEANASGSVSSTDNRKEKARARQAAILAKMRAEQSKFLASFKADADDASEGPQDGKGEHGSDPGMDFQEDKHDICSLCHDANSEDSVSFLVLLQKSRLVSFVGKGAPSWDQASESDSDKGKAAITVNKMGNPPGRTVNETSSQKISSNQLAQIVQRAVYEFSQDWRPAEVNSFIAFLKSRIPELKNIDFPCASSKAKEETAYSFESVEQKMFFSFQKTMGSINFVPNNSGDYQEASTNEKTIKVANSFLLGKYLAALARESTENFAAANSSASHSLESAQQILPYDGFGPTGCDGIHLSSCGHAVHQACLDRYLSSLKERYIRRVVFEGGHVVDPDQGEFLCPVCRRLANSILPALPRHCWEHLEQPMASVAGPPYYDDAMAACCEKNNCLHLKHACSLLKVASSVVFEGKNFPVFPIEGHRRIGQNLEPAFSVLRGMYFPGKEDMFSKSGRVSPSLVMWDTLKYSLVSAEIAARTAKASSTSATGLGSLYKELKSSGGFVLSLLLNIVQSTRSRNPLDILLRFIGIQLFGSSICYGVSPREGKILSVLKHIDADESFPDTQFWDQASSPVLVRDPFSALMWLLFCLPYPILSSRESFLSLVHMFYAVSATQALIAYFGNRQSSVELVGFHDCLVTDILQFVGESPFVQQYFVSNYINPDSDIRDVIRSFCLPYLRRCALLWKLLSSSMSMLRTNGNLAYITCDVNGKVVQYLEGELNEVSELEKMFAIPSLDDILGDGFLRSLAQVWFQHVRTDPEHGKGLRVLHLAPVVPFQLMRLPLVYQDLVQRFIKYRCHNCKAVQDDPALCLLCGRLCSPSRKPCCRESGCQSHSISCGAGTGVYLLIRRTTILLQRNARQAHWASPYLDAFGEEDVEIHRGKPLYLNEERYAALTYMVASHGLDRSSKVLRQTTIGPLLMV
ncbi:hypothetical protein Dimus_007354 [Dionaea muscipula]